MDGFSGRSCRQVAEDAVNMLTDESDQILACVLSAILKTIINGCATDRRFQQDPGACKFQCGGGGADSLDHYLIFPVIERL